MIGDDSYEQEHPDEAPDPEWPIVPGQLVFDRYRVIRSLGSGPACWDWLVHDISLDAQLALRVADPRIYSSPEGREQFLRGARSPAPLRHDNAVQVFDSGVGQG